jgi:hypothetical protein
LENYFKKKYVYLWSKYSLEYKQDPENGWTIINDPLFLKLSRQTEFFIDLAADKLLIVERQKIQIAVEIKSFIGRSTIAEFHMAVGQYLNYRLALQKVGSSRVLYLAVPQDTYRDFFADSFIDIKDDKIWVQRDFTEAGLAERLVELGVPKNDIVLAFRSPFVRQFTGFAVV